MATLTRVSTSSSGAAGGVGFTGTAALEASDFRLDFVLSTNSVVGVLGVGRPETKKVL